MYMYMYTYQYTEQKSVHLRHRSVKDQCLKLLLFYVCFITKKLRKAMQLFEHVMLKIKQEC